MALTFYLGAARSAKVRLSTPWRETATQATSAMAARPLPALYSPYSVATDSAGDLFVAEIYADVVQEVDALDGRDHYRCGKWAEGDIPATAARPPRRNSGVRKASLWITGGLFSPTGRMGMCGEVNLSSGVITTVAGTGSQQGYTGDGGKAIQAIITGPTSVAVDAAGHLFIADDVSGRIREVNLTTGVITTVAADLEPTGVAVDASGHLFIADTESNRICEVNLSTGIITTVPGVGTVLR